MTRWAMWTAAWPEAVGWLFPTVFWILRSRWRAEGGLDATKVCYFCKQTGHLVWPPLSSPCRACPLSLRLVAKISHVCSL